MGRLLLLLAALALVLSGCAGPDPRRATLVLEDQALEPAALDAIAMWAAATHGDADITIAKHCDSDHLCVKVSALEGEPGEWGGGFHWRPASDEPARISIAGWLLADQQSATTMLAHELGHLLGLVHTSDPDDLMFWIPGDCIGDPSLGAYNHAWDTGLSEPVCYGVSTK